ncbi:MAG: class I SAM-dependent methyltransferase [Gammaproteobacteria bacterium]|nr:class I SAM-dependent methyltransferase [Gammaproteobacteria bacterium]NND53905.1 class I SAM-dependent methyltransferase [Gammaproteobacteria bacterium]
MTAPSRWIQRHLTAIPRGSHVLDLACGSGRHLRLLRDSGYTACGVDRDTSAAGELASPGVIELLQYDLERDRWPFGSAEYAAIIVCNYLHRPLFPCIADTLQPGGVLLYETFAVGNEQYGRPRNPDFLLRPGELRAVFGHFIVLNFEELTEHGDTPAVRQRIAVRKPVV